MIRIEAAHSLDEQVTQGELFVTYVSVIYTRFKLGVEQEDVVYFKWRNSHVLLTY